MKFVSYLLLIIPVTAAAGAYEDGLRFLDAKAYSRAAQSFQVAAASGSAAAERQIGFIYYNGAGVKQDSSTAVAWFQRAADHGDLESQVNLGKMYENGLSAPQDNAKAAHYFRLAAEQGHRPSQLRYGEICYLGTGVSRDRAEAVKWWSLATEPEDSDSKRMRSMIQSALPKIPPDVVAEGERRALEWKLATAAK